MYTWKKRSRGSWFKPKKNILFVLTGSFFNCKKKTQRKQITYGRLLFYTVEPLVDKFENSSWYFTCMCKLYKYSILFYLFFISIICKIVEYKYGIVNEKLHVVSFAEIFWYFTCNSKPISINSEISNSVKER